jgi:hypothetical protein
MKIPIKRIAKAFLYTVAFIAVFIFIGWSATNAVGSYLGIGIAISLIFLIFYECYTKD